ncbi:MAG: glycosyltransferase [Mycobacterium sp.]|nr:glycosyltransferase [Mycobacterium sp.]
MTQIAALDPAMPPHAQPTWPHARWIGMLDLEESVPDVGLKVEFVARHAEAYRDARVLVRCQRQPIAFVDAPIVDGRVLMRVPHSDECYRPAEPAVLPPISVVVCTRDRPDQLADALQSILSLDYPHYEVVVVDNAARTDATAKVVERINDPRVRRVAEPVPGLSTARNTGLRVACHALVAFTDDDVVVDRHWLDGIVGGFARSPRVSCVSGLVPSGELRTAAQAYFDKRVSWAVSLRPRLYDVSEPPPDQPLFPFQIGRFGTGANFAVKRDRVLELGGFDEALGAGTAAQGGEDLDLFFRVLTAGDLLATEPSAIVWHRHRSDNEALLCQARGYGLGLGAWLTKVGLDPAHRRLAFKVMWRLVAGMVRRPFGSSLRTDVGYGAILTSLTLVRPDVPTSVGRTEVLAVLGGPRALWLGRRRRAQSRSTAVRG